jgi:hypothetical protein
MELGNPENVWACGQNKRVPFGVWPTVKNATDRVSKMYERGFL